MKRFLLALFLPLVFTACQNTSPSTPEAAPPDTNPHLLTVGVSVNSSGDIALVDLDGNRIGTEGFLADGEEIIGTIENIAPAASNTFTFDFVIENNSDNAWSDFRLGYHPKTSPRVLAVGYDANENNARFETGEVLYDKNAGSNEPVTVPNTMFSTGQMEPSSGSGDTSFTAPMAVRYSNTPFSLFLTVDAVDPSKPILVDDDAPGYYYGNDRYYDGATWATAYPNLQDALARARSSAATEIWIAAGTYYPDDGAATDGTGTPLTSPDHNRGATFFVDDGTKIYGGFDGTEVNRSERSSDPSLTILSGNIGDLDIATDNSYHVLYTNGATSVTVIDGVSVTAGQADADSPDNVGGAMYNDNGSPALTNVTFSGNSAGSRGGAMYNDNGSPALTNVTFSGNKAVLGGAMSNDGSSPTLTNVTFSGNSASSDGGAMFNGNFSSPTLTNVTFSGNSAGLNGGAMYNVGSSPTLTNVTFSGNSADDNGGAMYNSFSSPTLTNVILWGNKVSGNPNQIYQDGGVTISYSIVQGGNSGINDTSGGTAFGSGTGNINADPLFSDAANGDLTLSECSPAIDAGDNSAISLTTDINGDPRKVDDAGVTDSGNGPAPIVDIGAFEVQSNSANCDVIRVAEGATGDNLGYTWNNAVPTLQDALAIARNSDRKEIWIAAGTYYPDEGAATDSTGATLTNPDNDRTATFFVSEGMEIYGGFDGTEANRSDRDTDLTANVTILSGDIDGNDTVNPVTDPSTQIQGSNAYHVMYLDGSTTAITDATVIDRVSVTAGQADGSDFLDDDGGAMYNSNSSPTLTNVTFSGNSADSFGGAMYNNNSSSPVLNDVAFTGNSAGSRGGAMANFSNSPTLTNVAFTGNSAGGGGAMYNFASSDPTFTNVTFSGNSANGEGGAMYNASSDPTFTNVTFSGNSASGGGAVYNASSDPTFTNVTFSGNSARFDGGAVDNFFSNPTFTNVTFSSNSSSESADGGGAINNGSDSNSTLTNVILWGNTASSGSQQIIHDNATSGSLAISYSIVEGGEVGITGSGSTSGYDTSTNLDDDPLFVDANGSDNNSGTADDDLRLQSGSPAIDAGDNAALPQDTADLDGDNDTTEQLPLDLDGNTRVVNTTVDMGAYEVQP